MPEIKVTAVSLPDDWHAAFKAAADAKGQTVSEWLAEAGKQRLPKRTAAKLSPRKQRGRPKKGESDG